jgi:hypothetical protein
LRVTLSPCLPEGMWKLIVSFNGFTVSEAFSRRNKLDSAVLIPYSRTNYIRTTAGQNTSTVHAKFQIGLRLTDVWIKSYYRGFGIAQVTGREVPKGEIFSAVPKRYHEPNHEGVLSENGLGSSFSHRS